jgi:hypothetical protein
MAKSRKDGWRNKALHGQYLRQLDEETDVAKTFKWLTEGNLSIEAEGFITAAQDQAITTRAIAKTFHKTVDSDRCRLCGKHPETVIHILAECPTIAQTSYLERHNRIATYIHWRLMQKHGFQTDINWHLHQPAKVMENSKIKLLWDMNIHTDNIISARRPDILVIYKEKQSGQIIDINCPNDSNISKNEIGKMLKYTELKIELERIWKIHLKVVPIVIGCLGAVSRKATKYLEQIGINGKDLVYLQEQTLLDSCNILRRIITQSGIPIQD